MLDYEDLSEREGQVMLSLVPVNGQSEACNSFSMR